MRGLLSDLHVHSNFSDGKHTIAELIDFYGRLRFDVIALTDHFSDTTGLIGKVANALDFSLNEKKWDLYRETIARESKRAMEQYGLLVLTGFEVTKNSFNNNRSCHFLVIGAEEILPAETSVLESLKAYQKQNALTIAAHPLATGNWEFQSLHLWWNRELYEPYFDAWEVNCGRKFFDEVKYSGLPMVASSDLHHMRQINCWKTLIFAEKNQASIFQAIRDQKIEIIDYDSREASVPQISIPTSTSVSA